LGKFTFGVLLEHSKFDSIVRYLSIEVDDRRTEGFTLYGRAL